MTEEKIKISDLIDELEEKGIKLWKDEGKLKYSAPKGIMTSEIIQQLKNNKEQLIEEFERRTSEIKVIADPEKRYEKFPLSEIQGAYLMGRSRNMDFGGVACHIYMDFIYPVLDRKKVEDAWNEVISNNDTLHSVISKEGWQRVLPEWPRFIVKENDFTALSDNEAEIEVDKVKYRLGNEMFDTECFPLFHVELSKLSDRTIMHFSIDVLIADWTSIWIMLNEFENCYYNDGKIIKDIGITFRDYIIAYQNITGNNNYIKAKKYWQGKINEIPPAPQLPLRHEEIYEFDRFNVVLSPDKWEKLKKNCSNAGVTPVAALVTAYGSVLERYSINKRFSLNLTTLNRMPMHENVNSIIGDFTSISLLSTDFSGKESFAERALSVNKTLFEVLDNHLYSGIEVLREKARGNGGEKFFMPYVFTSAVSLIDSEGPGMKGVYRSGITQTPQVFIDCQVMDGKFGLQVNWDVRKGIFPEGMPEKMFALFRERIEKLSYNESAWKEDSLVNVHEDICIAENTYSLRTHLLHSDILEMAKKYPDKLAVADSCESWTYHELMMRASAVAAMLRKNRVPERSCIAVAMPKSVWQIAAVIGILSENCVYVPIDSGSAAKRLELIVKNADIKYIVSLSDSGVSAEGAEVIFADKLDIPDEILLKADGDIDSDAYIIHTSGSTGVPKGVVITHRGAVNTIEDINRRYSVNENDSILGLSQLNFDLSVYDIFGLLSVGGTVIYPDNSKYTIPSHWAELMKKYDITLWNSVPAFAQMMVSYLDSQKDIKFENHKAVLLSGDWIPLELPDSLKKYMPSTKVVSLGGATEASIWSNFYEYKELDKNWKSIPYGKALSNQEMYVLDTNLNICPVGVTGDIYIAGTGLARCYLNDKEKTDSAFIVHPVWKKRLYRTGDTGRYFSDGNIEFLGRADKQVKIRGHRIELGEIESYFANLDGVKKAVAVVGKNNASLKLAVFIVSDQQYNPDDLRGMAKEYLPDYMIPEEIIFIDEIPLTANGKTDHKYLEAYLSEKASVSTEKTALDRELTDTEKIISEIACRELKLEKIDINTNLYDYGANSLTMAQLAGHIAELLDSEDAFDSILVKLFDEPTIRSAAELIDEMNNK